MFESGLIELQTVWAQRCREAVTYPAAARRGVLQHDLARLQQERTETAPALRPAVVRWLGLRLVRLGRRLGGQAVTAVGNP